jgi:hypothetical protein
MKLRESTAQALNDNTANEISKSKWNWSCLGRFELTGLICGKILWERSASACHNGPLFVECA